MSDAALNAEELAALRAASQSLGAETAAGEAPLADRRGDGGAPSRAAATGADVRPVQLAAPDRQAKRRLPALEAQMALVLKGQRQLVSTVMRQSLDVALPGLTIAPVQQMAATVTSWLWGAVLQLRAAHEPLLWVGLPVPLGYHLIEVAFGGTPGEPGKLIDPRQLTRLEQETLWPFLRDVTDDLGKALHFGRIGEAELVPLAMPLTFEGLRTQESGILLDLQVPMKDGALPYQVVLLPKALEQLEALGAPELKRAATAKTASMAAHVLAAQVEVVANLGRTEVRLADLASLSPGQIIWLEHNQSDPIDLLVEGQATFTAMPMQRAGAVGVAILERLS